MSVNTCFVFETVWQWKVFKLIEQYVSLDFNVSQIHFLYILVFMTMLFLSSSSILDLAEFEI